MGKSKQVVRLFAIRLSLQKLVSGWRLLDNHFNAMPVGAFDVERCLFAFNQPDSLSFSECVLATGFIYASNACDALKVVIWGGTENSVSHWNSLFAWNYVDAHDDQGNSIWIFHTQIAGRTVDSGGIGDPLDAEIRFFECNA